MLLKEVSHKSHFRCQIFSEVDETIMFLTVFVCLFRKKTLNINFWNLLYIFYVIYIYILNEYIFLNQGSSKLFYSSRPTHKYTYSFNDCIHTLINKQNSNLTNICDYKCKNMYIVKNNKFPIGIHINNTLLR